MFIEGMTWHRLWLQAIQALQTCMATLLITKSLHHGCDMALDDVPRSSSVPRGVVVLVSVVGFTGKMEEVADTSAQGGSKPISSGSSTGRGGLTC